MVGFKICGPKLSTCGLLLSIWGILQGGIMSLAFYFRSVAMIEDIPLANETYPDIETYKQVIDEGYGNLALSCLVTTLCYVLTLVVSAHQVWVNNRSTAGSTRNNYANFQNER